MPEFVCPFFDPLDVDWGIQKPRSNCGVCKKYDITSAKCSENNILNKFNSVEKENDNDRDMATERD